MTDVITLADVNYMWQSVIMPRQGDVYVFGGSLNPTAVQVGTDCSGAVSEVDEALLYGPLMNWLRQFWTGTFAGANPGDRGPFGGVMCTDDWVCIADPRSPPAGAVMTVAVLQLSNPEDAHMVCAVLDPDNVTGFGGPGVYVGIESGGQFENAQGQSTLHIGPEATGVDDPMFNQYFALALPISDAPPAPPAPPPVPLTKLQQNALTVIAAGVAAGITPLGCQMGLCCALDESDMQMLANVNVPASLTYPNDGEGSNGESCGPFQQQVQDGWGTLACEMDWACSAGLFFTALARVTAAGGYNAGQQTQGWYIQQVQRSATADGSNYQAQWANAVALYDSVINSPAPQPGGFMSFLTQAQQTQMYDAICGPVTSQASFRQLGEGDIWTWAQEGLNDDGMIYDPYVAWRASLGDQLALAVLTKIASADVTVYPDRSTDITLAQAVLARLAAGGTVPPVVPSPSPNVAPVSPTPPPGPTPVPAPAAAPGTMTISVQQILAWGKDLLTVMGAVGTWATAVHDVLGQYLPGQSAVAVPALLAVGTAGLTAHTVHQKTVAQKQVVAEKQLADRLVATQTRRQQLKSGGANRWR
jgi:hypothetical protein